MKWALKVGAGDGIRTRDINLGKVALYQLSYSRMMRHFDCRASGPGCQRKRCAGRGVYVIVTANGALPCATFLGLSVLYNFIKIKDENLTELLSCPPEKLC
jgi:hypothetical protein